MSHSDTKIHQPFHEFNNFPKDDIDVHKVNHSEIKFVHNVQIKGTIVGTKPKTIQIHPHSNKFIIYSNQTDKQKNNFKQFPLHQLTFSHEKRENKGKTDYIHIDTNNGKKFTIKSDSSGMIADQILNSQKTYHINQKQFNQQSINTVPKQVNYMNPLAINSFQKMLIPQNQNIFYKNLAIIPSNPQQSQKSQLQLKFTKRKFYFDPSDWVINKDKGTIVFINQQKKNNQKKVIGWLLKKFLTSGSFMGISFPTFIMKPQTILQSYAKAIGAAPFLFQNVLNPVQRMKKLICLIHSFSLVFCDLTKPFNPPIGETFQAKIANAEFYAEQISHHPPISAFLLQGKDYKLSGALQLTASIGPNSATGLFVGDLKLEFEDGSVYIGRIPGGQFSGFIVGDQKFQASGSFYVYNNKKLVCSVSCCQKSNFFTGYIGKLKQKYEDEFFKEVNNSNRFSKFPFYDRKCFDTVYSSMQMNYSNNIVFDGKEYFNVNNEKFLPFIPEQIERSELLLRSDSRYRKDVKLRKQQRFDQSQKQKQKMEEEQRYFRKLRAKNGGKQKT